MIVLEKIAVTPTNYQSLDDVIKWALSKNLHCERLATTVIVRYEDGAILTYRDKELQ